MDRPDLVLERLLMLSPESRAERRAQRVGEIAIKPRRHLRGRKRPSLVPSDGLELKFSTEVPIESINALKEKLRDRKDPLFDQFTQGYRVRPNSGDIKRYTTAANVKNKRRPGDLRTPDERRADLRRQTQNVADNLEQETFRNLLTAKLRRQSLRTTQWSIANGQPLDDTAARFAADAVLDFGFCLLPQKGKIAEQPSDIQLGTQLIYIGEQAVDNQSLLKENPDVLTIVQTEQAKREKFWGERFDFMSSPNILGDRLVKDDKASQAAVEVEIARQTDYNLAS